MLELSSGVAGAYCGKLLADAGARVTVLEPPEGHALSRHRRMDPPAQPGLLFDYLSQGKERVSTEELTATGPGTLGEIGLLIRDQPFAASGPLPSDESGSFHWPEMTQLTRATVPIVVTISPFGNSGPWANRPASELVVQALSGSLIRRGLPAREPVQAGGSITEWVAGSYAAAVAASFWWGTAKAPKAETEIDISILECAIVALHPFATVESEFGRAFPGTAHRGPSIPSIEPTRDGYVGFATITGQQLHDFFCMIERPDLADDLDLVSADVRQSRRSELVDAIHSWTMRHATADIIERATALRIPVAPIGNGENVLGFEHLVERRAFVRGPGGVLRPRSPFHFSGIPGCEERVTAEHPAMAPMSGSEVAGPRATSAATSSTIAAGAGAPLHGVKVADFTAFWAGPAATHALACLGAEVIKVESVQRPDGMRFTSCKPRDERWWEWSAVFHGVNTNKRSVTLKLDDHRGRELALQLVEWADVVIENYSPRVMEQFELDWAVISSRNPRAIMLRLPAFGLTGPWRDRPGFAMTVEQMSGLAWQTGYQDGPPMDVGGVCDPLGGMHAVVALIAGLAERQRRGTGMLIEVPLLEVALNVAAEHVLQFSANGAVLPRLGNRSADAAPQGVYACAGDDAWVAVSVMNDRQWMSLCRVLELDDLRDDKALEVVEGRRREHARIDRALAGRFRCMASGDAEARLTGAGVPAAAVPVPVDVIGNPQLAARGFFEAVDHPVVGRYRLPSLPVVVGRVARRWHRTPPPTLGQHNDEVIRGLLGVAEEELRTLENEGVVGTAPVTT